MTNQKRVLPHIRQLRGGVTRVSVASSDVALHLPVAQAVGGAALVTGHHPLPLHLADQTLQVVSLAPHLRVVGGQAIVTLTWQTETELVRVFIAWCGVNMYYLRLDMAKLVSLILLRG